MSSSSGDPDSQWTQPGDSTGTTANPAPSGYGTPSSPSYGKYGQGTALPPPPSAAVPPNQVVPPNLAGPPWGGPTQPGQPGYGSGQPQWGQPGYAVTTRTGPAPGDPTTVEPTEVLGRATIAVSALIAVVVVAAAAFNPNQHQFLKDTFDAALDGTQIPPTAAAEGYNLVSALLGLVEIGGWLTVCLWLTRIRQNLVALRQYGRRRSEAWVWLGWVIPFVNFWFPFQVVSDAVNSTAVAAGVTPIRTGPWWTAWLGMLLSGSVVTVSQMFPPDQTLHRILVAVVAVVTVVALVLWVRIVIWLGRHQDAQLATRHPVSQ